MNYKSIILLCFLIIFGGLLNTGCARKTHLQKAKESIFSYGPNEYSVIYSGFNRNEVRSIVNRAASDYCREQGKYLTPTEETASGLAVELKFTCESK